MQNSQPPPVQLSMIKLGEPFPCIITVKGDGRGRYGHPKADKTGPIRDFLFDNVVYYNAVKKHVRQCTICDPVAILEHYLQRRITIPKFQGQTSQGLVQLAETYRDICKKRNIEFPYHLLNEFYCRSCDPQLLLEHRESFSPLQCIEAVRLLRAKAYRGAIDDVCRVSLFYRAINDLLEDVEQPDAQQLSELIEVVKVLAS